MDSLDWPWDFRLYDKWLTRSTIRPMVPAAVAEMIEAKNLFAI
jgi:hypothetical protein